LQLITNHYFCALLTTLQKKLLKPKLLILTSRFPYPLEKGDKLRVFHQIKALSLNYQIVLVALSDIPVSESELSALSPYCSKIEILHLKKWKIYFRIVLNFITGKLPLQVAYFVDNKLCSQVKKRILQENPDHLYCQLIRTSEYIKDCTIPKTLDLMDAFSEGALRRSRDTKGPMHYFWKREARLLREYEQKIATHFNHLSIISKQDGLAIGLNHHSLHVVPNGVDTDFFNKNSLQFKPPTYDIVFVGNMGYHPNIQAATYLVEQLLPKLNFIFPNLKILIAGTRPSPKIQSFANQQITVTGWVEDIRLAYSDAKILVAPLFHGSGQQNKILEAMSMSIPCITTTMVNNAIGATHKEHILIADTADEYVKYIRDLLQQPEKRKRIGDNAQSFVKQNFSWHSACQILIEII
jgi:polysaccharide biosynthesis protein PslH